MALAPNTGYGLLNAGTTLPTGSPQIANSSGTITNWGALNQLRGAGDMGPYGGARPAAPTTTRQQSILPQSSPSFTYNPPSNQQPLSLSGTSDYTLDPAVQAALAMEQQGLGQLDAQLQSARERAIINFGDPALAQEAGFGLDPQAGAFAQQNYQSGNATLARLEHLHQLNARQVVNNLASHGILNSGDYGYLEGEENRGYGNNVYDARQSVLDMLSNLYSNYLNSRQGYQQNILSALLQAAGNAGSQAGGGYYPTDQGVQQQQVSAGTSLVPSGRTTYSQPRKGKAVTGPSIFAFK